MGKGRIADEFEVTWSNDTRLVVRGLSLSLRPKQPSPLQVHRLRGRCRRFLGSRKCAHDQQGNVNHFAFSDLKMNAKVSDEVFRWSRRRVRVVDTGKMDKP